MHSNYPNIFLSIRSFSQICDCDFRCEDIHSLPSALPNSLFTYGPMLLIMILNPILYFNSMKEYTINLSNLLNQQTENERTYHKTFKMKYALITVIFYVCWLPNLINGMFIWFLWHDLPLGGILICWYAMVNSFLRNIILYTYF